MGNERYLIFFFMTLSLCSGFLSADALGAPAAAPITPIVSDPELRPDRPTLSGVRAIRFLTSDDYPPLNFAREDGTLTGFNVEIARAICDELGIGCTIQARRWDTLMDALHTGKGDAVVASIAATPVTRDQAVFSQPYYQTPARFIARKGSTQSVLTQKGLAGKTVGVVGGSSHEAYLKTFFPGATPKPYPNVFALETALAAAEIDLAFADGLTFSVWLSDKTSKDCCEFRGGPYCESRYFGEGVGIAVRKDDVELLRAVNWALSRLVSKGVYSELYLKYFPIVFY